VLSKKEIIALQNEVIELRAQNKKLIDQERFVRDEIRRLELIIASLKHKIFGKKSETVDINQLLLELGEHERQLKILEATNTQEQASVEAALKQDLHSDEARRHKSTRIEYPESVEVIEKIEIPDHVSRDRDAYEEVGEPEVTEVIDVIPLRVIVTRTIRPKFRRKEDRTKPLVVAKVPERILKGGFAAVGLLAFIIVSKYVDHLPLHRLELIFKRLKVIIPRQRMADWINDVAQNWLGLIYHSIRQGVLEQNYLGIDETPLRYNDTKNPKGKCGTGYVWTYVAGNGDLFYDWQMTRGNAGLFDTLNGWNGKLLCDGYGVYKSYAAKHGLSLFACNAHARRRFKEAWELGEKEGSAWYLLKYSRLFEIEREIREEGLDVSGILEKRKGESRAIFNEIRERIAVETTLVSANSKLKEAMDYMLRHWDDLTRYLEHAEVAMDTNAVERAIRPLKLGMKNWLFVGHPNAGKNCAILFTILEQCKQAEVNPYDYLTDVLNRLPKMSSNAEAMSALTPKNWAKAKRESVST